MIPRLSSPSSMSSSYPRLAASVHALERLKITALFFSSGVLSQSEIVKESLRVKLPTGRVTLSSPVSWIALPLRPSTSWLFPDVVAGSPPSTRFGILFLSFDSKSKEAIGAASLTFPGEFFIHFSKAGAAIFASSVSRASEAAIFVSRSASFAS